jgi:hypothetical protein
MIAKLAPAPREGPSGLRDTTSIVEAVCVLSGLSGMSGRSEASSQGSQAVPAVPGALDFSVVANSILLPVLF